MNKTKLIRIMQYFFFALLLYAYPEEPETVSILTVKIHSKTTQMPLVNCIVCIISDTLFCETSNKEGHCFFKHLPFNTYSIQFHRGDFDTLLENCISIDSKHVTEFLVELDLENKDSKHNRIIMVVKPSKPSLLTSSMSHDDLMNSTGTGNDLNRILSIHPSTISAGTIDDNSLIIRGGHSQENVYIIDGLVLDYANHFATIDNKSGGGIGYINPDLINKVEFYAGVTPASFPSRTSSVVDIHLLDEVIDNKNCKVDLNISGVGLMLGRSFGKKKNTCLFNIRWMDLTFLKNIKTITETPKYGDGILKLVFNLNNTYSLTIHGIMSYDNFKGNTSWESNFIETVYEKDLLQIVGGITSTITTSNLLNNTIVSYSIVNDKYFKEYSYFRNERIYTTENTITHINLHNDFSYTLNSIWNFDIGLGGGYDQYYVRHQLYVSFENDTSISNVAFNGYIQNTIESKHIRLLCGVRCDYFNSITDFGFSPKLNIAVSFPNFGSLNISSGLAYQLPPEFNKILRPFLLPYDSIPARMEDMKLQRCWQSSISYNRIFTKSHTFTTEAYLKWYDKEYPFISPKERCYYINSIQTIDNVKQRRLYKPDGKKKSMGMEVSIQNSTTNPLHYYSALSLSSVKNKYLNGQWYSDRNDIRQVMTLIISPKVGKHHRLSLQLSASKGRPIPNSSNDFYSERFNSIWSLNFRYSNEFCFKKVTLVSYLEFKNLLNQKQIVDRQWDGSEYIDRKNNGILPLAGITISF